jgi:3-isopropylmalate/(R)-2-methylmalate dehydratase small subunit
MQPFTTLTSRIVPFPTRDIDTDQIIPARFLKTTVKSGLGEALFNDWRYEAPGVPRAGFILNQPRAVGASILLAGDNFGCGSSREHAPWALMAFGFRAVISTSFGDIFRNNSLKNGLLPVQLEEVPHAALMARALDDPSVEVTIDLGSRTVKLPDGELAVFPIDAFSRSCLLAGVDQLGYLLRQQDRIKEFEAAA